MYPDPGTGMRTDRRGKRGEGGHDEADRRGGEAQTGRRGGERVKGEGKVKTGKEA